MDGGTRAAQALVDSGIEHTITRHGMVRSLEEAAAARGVEPRDIIKTLVVRRGEGDHLFVLVPGDPLPFGTTLMLTASGPVACALVLSATPAVLSSPLQTWIHGGGTSIYCFMNVRGRRIAPWIGLLGMVLVFAAWAVADGRGAAYGISFVAIDAAPLAMATLLSFTLRPTAKAVARVASSVRSPVLSAVWPLLGEKFPLSLQLWP